MNTRTIGLYAAVLSMALVACQGDTIIAPDRIGNEGIHVAGEGKVSASADIAYAQLGVQTFAAKLEEALEANNTRMASINQALKNAGIASDDLRTTQFNVYPQYNYEKETREIVGYSVDNQLKVTFRDLKRVGTLLQTALNAGANTTYGVRFGIEDTDALRAQARVLAVTDARQRALTIADAAGVKLGQALDIYEVSNNYPVYARAEFDDIATNSVPLESVQLDVSTSVQVLFAIRP